MKFSVKVPSSVIQPQTITYFLLLKTKVNAPLLFIQSSIPESMKGKEMIICIHSLYCQEKAFFILSLTCFY